MYNLEKNMNQTIPYTYLIGWTAHNKWYYGCRYKDNCGPQGFWKDYFTSSKYVKKFREEFGEPDVIQIRKTFTDKKKAKLWEGKVLDRLHAPQLEKWLNKVGSAHKNMIMDSEIRAKISKGNLGKKRPPETGAKISAAKKGKPSHLKGKKRDPEIVKKAQAALVGRSYVDLHGEERAAELKREISNRQKGKPAHNKGTTHTPEAKEKMRQKQLEKIKQRRESGYKYTKKTPEQKQAMAELKRGLVCWNNGEINRMSREELPAPWVKGRVKKPNE